MSLGTKILLLMLAITVGCSAVVSWIVTLNVTGYERDRNDQLISFAITRYQRELESHNQQISRIVQTVVGDPENRSYLQGAEEDDAKRLHLKEEIFGREVRNE